MVDLEVKKLKVRKMRTEIRNAKHKQSETTGLRRKYI
jgi:hypothetical protein